MVFRTGSYDFVGQKLTLSSLFFRLVANDGAIPFNTQFFHDDDDDGPGFDDLYDGDGMPDGDPMPVDAEPGERDLLSETQGQTRRIRPEAVNDARRAKRVDVRKLKENIWKGLDIVIPPSQAPHDGDGYVSMVRLKSYSHPRNL